MIYIVEIPRHRQPFCWSAHDEADAVSKMRLSMRILGRPDYIASFSEWIKYNSLDLHSQYVFIDAAAAINGLKLISGHSADQAIAELREELMANGELPKEVSNGH